VTDEDCLRVLRDVVRTAIDVGEGTAPEQYHQGGEEHGDGGEQIRHGGRERVPQQCGEGWGHGAAEEAHRRVRGRGD
ncbi:hypothetical protein ABE10_02565, partial [Bacillus toyonensis]|nr:hypothetical protein [Bacillus toyonensis]